MYFGTYVYACLVQKSLIVACTSRKRYEILGIEARVNLIWGDQGAITDLIVIVALDGIESGKLARIDYS